jgi:hypothetical protein
MDEAQLIPLPIHTHTHNKSVYYEQTGRIDQAALRAAGITVDDMIFNYIYLNEYLYSR